tara:strand:+ start:7458 stop:7682 length:225 start_codon:yes stop_codon:yes gene_type:complete
MSFILKKIVFSILFNSSLFILLIIGIQNSSRKIKVDLLINESIKLPISFIIGSSFIFGSITGSLVSLNLKKEQD